MVISRDCTYKKYGFVDDNDEILWLKKVVDKNIFLCFHEDNSVVLKNKKEILNRKFLIENDFYYFKRKIEKLKGMMKRTLTTYFLILVIDVFIQVLSKRFTINDYIIIAILAMIGILFALTIYFSIKRIEKN